MQAACSPVNDRHDLNDLEQPQARALGRVYSRLLRLADMADREEMEAAARDKLDDRTQPTVGTPLASQPEAKGSTMP
jgi:hypothetical protein